MLKRHTDLTPVAIRGVPARRRRSGDREEGFTSIELVTATMLTLLIVGAFGTLTVSLLRTDIHTTNGENASEMTRLAVIQLQRDLQSANPLDALSTATQYNTEVDLQLGPVGGTQQEIIWSYSASTQILTRTVGSGAAETELTGVVNGSATPVFVFYDAKNNQLSGASGTDSANAAAVAQCASRVNIRLLVAGGTASPTPQQTFDVPLENEHPGGPSCG